MNLKEWAAREGVSYSTARRWLAAGTLPVPARKIGGLILVGDESEGIPELASRLLAACAGAFGPDVARDRAHEAVDAAAEAGDAP